jgi:hypothetical protein
MAFDVLPASQHRLSGRDVLGPTARRDASNFRQFSPTLLASFDRPDLLGFRTRPLK